MKMKMTAKSTHSFISCCTALETILHTLTPCLESAIHQWHHRTAQNIPSCANPAHCPQGKKPSIKNNACQACIEWAAAIEAEVFPSSVVGSLHWANVNPSMFGTNPLEAVKVFASSLAEHHDSPESVRKMESVEDFDNMSLLMTMGRFKPFHNGNQFVFEYLLKLLEIWNHLTQLKSSNTFQLDASVLEMFWRNVVDLLHGLQSLDQPMLPQQSIGDLFGKLYQIKGDKRSHSTQQDIIERTNQAEIERNKTGSVLQSDNQSYNPRNIVSSNTKVYGDNATVLGDYYRIAGNLIVQGTQYRRQPSIEAATITDTVQLIAEDLKDFYLNNYCKKPIYPWKTGNYVELDNSYVPLTMDINLPGIRPIKERLKSYTDIFDNKDDNKRLLLTGSPGQGKSTFCAKLAFDWSQNVAMLSHVKLLFIVQLAKVTHLSNIEDAICSQLLSSQFDSELAHKVIKKLGKDVVIVLDGLDEAPTDLLRHEITGNLVEIIQFKFLRHCRVLITSRPWRENEITGSFPEYKRLQLRRMTKADVTTYVRRLFNHNLDDLAAVALGKRLLKYINDNKVLVDLSIPLVVLLISWYWIKTNGEKGIPNRIGNLYREIISIMLGESCHESGTQSETITDRLGQLSIQGLTPNETKIVFSQDEIIECCGDEVFRVAHNSEIISKRGDTSFQFFHKSGQEFCAGIYLRNHPDALAAYLNGIVSVKDALSVAPVLQFASGSIPSARLIIGTLLQICSTCQDKFREYYNEQLSFDETKPIQKLIKLCLDCNFEANASDTFSGVLSDLFVESKVLLYGISSKTAVSLAYYMQHCDPMAIRDVTLRPVPNVSDPKVFFGPTVAIYDSALQQLKTIPDDKIQQLHDKFVAANPHLHEEWARRRPSHLAAYIPCIQACEGMPSSADTNTTPFIDSFKYVSLEKLNVNHVQLGDNFDCFLDALENDDLKFLPELQARSIGCNAQETTRLVSSLHKMPLLEHLNISANKGEADTIPILTANLKQCRHMKKLYVNDLGATASNMELLANALPSQLTELTLHGNDMNDQVASCLVDVLPQTLTLLSLTVANVSERKHDDLLRTLHSKLGRLEDLRISGSPFPGALLEHSSQVLRSCMSLTSLDLRVDSTCSDNAVLESNAEVFAEALQHAGSIRKIGLYGIKLTTLSLMKLVDGCRRRCMQKLRFDKDFLPSDVLPDDLDDFVILV